MLIKIFLYVLLILGVKNNLIKSISTELWTSAQKTAKADSIQIFANNLYNLLMVPPLLYHMNNPADYVNHPTQKLFCICGIDPGFLNGHKLVVLDSNEELVHKETLYYHKDRDKAVHKFKSLCESFDIRVISIGNGTGSIEVDYFY